MTSQSKQYAAFVRDRRAQVAGYFKRKRLQQHPKWPHVLLDRDGWSANVVAQAVAGHVQREIARRKAAHQGFALHTWVQDGLSSQAFLFSLLGPAVVDRNHTLIDRILGLAGVPVDRGVIGAEFEFEDRDVYGEYRGQPTSVDLALTTEHGGAVYVECKFTESDFGRCSCYRKCCDGANPLPNFHSACHLSAVKKLRYWEVFQRHGLPGVNRADLPTCPVRSRYQLYRLMGFAMEKSAKLVLLYDERNPRFVGPGGCYSLMLEALPNEVREKCHTLSVQTVLRAIRESGGAKWLAEFVEKYM